MIFIRYHDEHALRSGDGGLIDVLDLEELIRVANAQIRYIRKNREEFDFDKSYWRYHHIELQVSGDKVVGNVYFARRGDGAIKVGFSRNPPKRVKGQGLEFISSTEGRMSNEQAAHHFFYEKRIEGEFFNLTESDIELAIKMIRKSWVNSK